MFGRLISRARWYRSIIHNFQTPTAPVMSSASDVRAQQHITSTIPGYLSSDVDSRMTTSSIGYTSYRPKPTSETASSLSSSSITTSSVSSDTESISSLELSPPQITIEVLENSQNIVTGENIEPETFLERALEEGDSDDSAMEYQDVDIYTDEASDGGSLQWDERASISDTDAVYNFEDFEEESLSSHGN